LPVTEIPVAVIVSANENVFYAKVSF